MGSPTARTASSFAISDSIVVKLTVPGSERIAANTAEPSSASASPINASIRAATSPVSREPTRSNNSCSPRLNAERTIRSTRPPVGGSIFSSRHQASTWSRTASAPR